MRSSILRRAQAFSIRSRDISEAKSTLLPPLPLYRRILRIHRKLPLEMRSLGDDYVKAEFQRHKQTDNPVHIMGFLLEWKKYLDVLEQQEDPQKFRGKPLDATMFDKMSEEQLGQLYELMHASKDIWKPVDELQDPSKKRSKGD